MRRSMPHPSHRSYLRCSRFGRHSRKAEKEARALAGSRFDPNPPAVPLDDALADRQAHSGAGILLTGMQPLEDLKNPAEMLRVNANPIIAHRKDPFSVPLLRANVNPRVFCSMKFDGIA